MTAIVDQEAEPLGLAQPSSTQLVLERAESQPGTAQAGRRWLGLAALLGAMIMNLLDSTVINIGAPAIRRDLGGSLASLQWIAASYTLALAVGLLTGGRLGDMYGRRRMLMIGLVGFVAASTSCGLAWSPQSLILARVVQGLFAAVMVPQVFGLIRDLFPPAEIGKAFAALGPVIGLSTVVGPLVAGLLINVDLFGAGWRTIFLINLPLGAFALIAGRKALPGRTSAGRLGSGPSGGPSGATSVPTAGARGGLDVIGTLIAGSGMFMLVYPLVQGRELGWPTWSFAVLAGSIPVFGLFVAQQLRRSRSGRKPLVELSVLAKRSYASGVVFVIVFFGSIVGFSLTVGLFLQVGLGFSAIKASLFMAAFAVGAFFGSGIGAVAMVKVGRPILHIGLSIMAVSIGGLWLGLGASNGRPGFLDLAPALLVFGFGMGMIFVPLFDIIMGEIEDHEVGSAAALLESLQQLGASLGIAALATVFFSTLGFDQVGPRAALAAGRHIDAARTTSLLALGLIGVAFAIGFWLPKKARQSD